MDELQPGLHLGTRFKLERLLGEGHIGQVWLAHDLELDEQVALKVIDARLAESDQDMSILREESRQARRLAHPNIVRIFDLHRAGPRRYLSMEYVAGGDLGQMHGQDWRSLVHVLLTVVDALEYAHGQGVVHRNLKLSNVLMTADGIPRLADFGMGGLVAVSEIAEGRRYDPPSPLQDIRGLGVLCYQLLTGEQAFEPGPGNVGKGSARCAELNADDRFPRPLAVLVDAMLGQNAGEWPEHMQQVGDALQELLLEEAPSPGLPPAAEPPSLEFPEPEEIAVEPRAELSQPSRGGADRSGRRGLTFAIALLFAGLLAMGVGVFFYLPSLVAERDLEAVSVAPVAEQTTTVPSPAAPSPSVADSQDSDLLEQTRLTAEQALNHFTALRQQLEARAVEVWGSNEYLQALALSAQADQALVTSAYAQASALYDQGSALLSDLESHAADALAVALADGQVALQEVRAQAAAEAFGLALRIEPDNETATRGLAKAAVVEEVASLLAEGDRFRERDQFEQALDSYRQALQLDADSKPVQTAIAAVETVLAEQKFAAAMSDTLIALEASDFERARTSLDRAAALRPKAPEVADARVRLQNAERSRRIGAIRSKARQLDARGQWAQAEKQYRRALEIDSTLVFARQGARRSGQLARLTSTMDRYLDDPGRLYSLQPRDKAVALLQEARAVKDPPAGLQKRIGELQSEVDKAAKPLRVQLVSDGLTDVTIYRVGKQGTFQRRDLYLAPGEYTVVGTRSGYRDVRRHVKVLPGAPVPPVLIRCEERV